MQERTHPRLTGYNYNENGGYFITFCTRDRKPMLSSIFVGRDDPGAPSVSLTQFGKIVEGYIQGISKAYVNVKVDAYVIMPNHVHLLLAVNQEEETAETQRATMLVSRVVTALKRFSNRDCGQKLWQDSYYDHVIRNEQDYLKHWRYIEENPAKWSEDELYYRV